MDKDEQRRAFLAANIAELDSYTLSKTHDKLWLDLFGKRFRVEGSLTHGRGHQVTGLGDTYVNPDRETLDDALARCTAVRDEHFADESLYWLFVEMKEVRWRFDRIEVGDKFTMNRSGNELRHILAVLTWVATGTLPTNYVEIHEFMDRVGAESYGDCKAFEGEFCGLQLKGYKNGRLDVSGLTSDQQGRLAMVYTLANKRFTC